MADHDFEFEFERDLQNDFREQQARPPPQMPVGEIGQQPRNFVRNYKKTVCAFWIKGMCMKGDNCGFLHEMVPERMPECTTFLKKGFCNDPDCKFKHSRENIKECNMYALGFCIFGPECRYNHTRKPGPPPDPSTVEAAKPKAFRDINRVVNAVNEDVANDGPAKRPRIEEPYKPLPLPQFPAAAAQSGSPQRPHATPPNPTANAPYRPQHGQAAGLGGPRPMMPPSGPRPNGIPHHMGLHRPPRPMGMQGGPPMGGGFHQSPGGAGPGGPQFRGPPGGMRPDAWGGGAAFHRRPQQPGMF
eukprot:jgi/Ulvmu1/1794/UM119_0012.1